MIDRDKYLAIFRQQMDNWVVFNDEEWSVIVNFLHFRMIAKKDHFTKAGEVCRELGFILSGSIRLYHLKGDEEITSYFCLDNEFITSYKSFIRQEPGKSSIQVLEDTLVVTFDYNGLQQLLNHPVTAYKMERFGRLMAEDLVSCYEDRLLTFITQTPEERYASLLENSPRVLQHIPQYYVASYLGITPVSLSRIRKRILKA